MENISVEFIVIALQFHSEDGLGVCPLAGLLGSDDDPGYDGVIVALLCPIDSALPLHCWAQ